MSGLGACFDAACAYGSVIGLCGVPAELSLTRFVRFHIRFVSAKSSAVTLAFWKSKVAAWAMPRGFLCGVTWGVGVAARVVCLPGWKD